MDAQKYAKQLYTTYQNYKESSLQHRRFKHADIVPLIKVLDAHEDFNVQVAGQSVEGKDIYHLSYGHGETTLLLWSQMHGDEPTATMALFDIFNFLASDDPDFRDFRNDLKDKLSIHFIPMLNPDGADLYQRRNAMNVDLNRDAMKLEFPESQILKKTRDQTNADFGFNLHDQSKYYNVGLSANTAALSFLAPAYDYEKGINSIREKAMQLIVVMNETAQQFLPGHVGRYNDDFEPRAFGDNIQKWGTSTILVEAGGLRGDDEKQINRKIHFCLLLSAFKSLADQSYLTKDVAAYEAIPKNDRKMADLILRNLSINTSAGLKTVDLSFKSEEIQNEKATDFYTKAFIDDLGDLSTSFGYKEFNAEGLSIKMGKTASLESLNNLDANKWLKKGYGDLIWSNIENEAFSYRKMPINIHEREQDADTVIKPGANPSFFLVKDGELRYAVVNGSLISLY